MSWETLKLGDVTEFIRNGKSVKQSKEVNGLPITRIETIWNSSIDTTRVGYAGLSEGEAKGYLLERGDVLFSHINSLDHIGKCAMYSGEPEKLVHGMNLLCIRPKKGLMYSKFLTYLLRTKEFNGKLLSVTNKSVNQASVSTTNLKNISISLPPREQQKRIAAILDKADELRAKRRRAIAKLDELLKSVFLELFGDPVTNPKGWGKRRLDSLGKVVTGNTPSRQKQAFYGSGIEWIKSDNINTSLHYLTEAEEHLSEQGEKVGRTAPPGSTLERVMHLPKELAGALSVLA